MEQVFSKILRLGPGDNVAVALIPLEPGMSITSKAVACREHIPAGHKIAIDRIETDAPVRKYGQIIGFASKHIEPGSWVHTHNVKIGDFSRDYAFCSDAQRTEFAQEGERLTFEGIVRDDGRVGTRNYVGILATVNCSASVGRFISESIPKDVLVQFPNTDGVVFLGHGSGCGMVMDGEGFRLLQSTLAGYAHHPNFAGILLLGLGCEVNEVVGLMENMKLEQSASLKAINIQEAGGTRETVRRGVDMVMNMLREANRVKRQPVEAGNIVLGLECGGSDAYSGISANPALGAAVDLLVRQGGTAILSETPEIYGAEHLLTRRARNREVGEKLIRKIRWWEDYTRRLGGDINNNPTPGNKAGGLTTILEKSLGAIAKGGTTDLMEVYDYAEQVSAGGLVFMDTPGYDSVSVTGMVAGGANVICFTTGRGTVCGFKPVPTVKLASSSEMYGRLQDDMDINCGLIVEGKRTLQEMGEVVFRMILETASGKKSKSELLGFGESEFVPWQLGPVL